MKNLMLVLILLVQVPAFAKTVKELEVQCKLQAKITEVYDIQYSKGLPARGRFGGTDPSLGFKADVEVISQQSGCSVLVDKYKVYLGQLQMSGGISPAQESQSSEILALKNKVVELTLNQHIGYQINGYLPLFPTVHAENLSLSFKEGAISGYVPLPFDLNWVYGITKVEDLSDIEKLALAEKTSGLAMKGDFHSLFLALEPAQVNLKKAYGFLIWKAFKQHLQDGPGSSTGAPLAVKFNKLTHYELFSGAELAQLLSDFPTWILAGYSGEDCLNFSPADLENFLLNTELKYPVMTLQEKWLLKDPLAVISGGVHYVSRCTEGKVSEKAKQLALEILKK